MEEFKHNIVQQMDDMAEILAEIVRRDRHYAHVKEFVKTCGDEKLQREWNSLTKEEQKSVSEELYYYFKNSQATKAKTVIYKSLGVYYATNERNFYAAIRNAREVQKLDDFDSAEEIIAYYCEHFGCKTEDFIIIE